MKILITGATGLIGEALTSLLIEKGHSVNYLTTDTNKIVSKPNSYGYFWNPSEGKIDENCLINVDAIIHLAGASIAKRWTTSYKNEIVESRILSAELLYKTLKKYPHQVKQIISASAIGIYPESESLSYDESTTEKDTGFLGNVVSKWEESVDKFQQLQLKVCKIRTGVVLAKNGGALPEMAKPIKMYLGANMGNGKQIQSWIHINDLVQLYYFALQNELEGVFNAVAPNPVSNAELTKAIAKKLHKPLFLPSIPEFVMHFILGEMASLVFSSKNVSAKKVIKTGFQFQFPTLETALADIYK
ncbi:MAG: TIGR01777 family oxidoreductase [Bacteroidota bacterium]